MFGMQKMLYWAVVLFTSSVVAQSEVSVNAVGLLPDGSYAASFGNGFGEDVQATVEAFLDETTSRSSSTVNATGVTNATNPDSPAPSTPSNKTELPRIDYRDILRIIQAAQRLNEPTCYSVSNCEDISNYDYCGYCIEDAEDWNQLDPYTYESEFRTFGSYFYTSLEFLGERGNWLQLLDPRMYEVKPIPVKDCNGIFLTSQQLCPRPSCSQVLGCLHVCSGVQHLTFKKHELVTVTRECADLCKWDDAFYEYC
eukprot:TRINITY_DN5522_c1_g1_i5.p2 TRINITY_DN5522_c1_g1~~TRINITY_DN5522_c1_g1_i5.p2  ORF type:complete len:254 (-),score=23.28 TRINITY_DN5522_c1_g1_i5:228-989(-)